MGRCACNGICFATNYYTQVCSECGVETYLGIQPEFDYTFRSLPIPYSRKSRFKDLVRKLLGQEPGPKTTDPVWALLEQNSPYNSTHDIVRVLKRSKLQNKFYCSLHVFSKLFLKKYEPPPYTSNELQKLQCVLLQWFEETLMLWNKTASDTGFFSYSWLIEKFLHCLKISAYSSYLKRLMCPLRRDKYVKKWKTITRTSGAPSVDLRPYPSGRPLTALEIS